MSWKHYVRQVLEQPPRVIARKTAAVLQRRLLRFRQRRRDLARMTFLPHDACPGPLRTYLSPVLLDRLIPHAEQIAAVSRLYLDHFFDLLGSGWVQVRHGMACLGVEGRRYDCGAPVVADTDGKWLAGRINRANLAEAQRIWRLVEVPYQPIDWHLDFKSGHRWPENQWYHDVRYGHRPGVDVKAPWELARMQHLPQLAWAFALADAGQPGFAPADAYRREFRNQVLDFMAVNPPRFGVNWRCTMDVAIRATNWLIAYDLLLAHGARFDDAFEQLFVRSIYEHGRFIQSNLEWDPQLRTNHYLADVAGLLFVAAYLPSSGGTDAWLRFAIAELVSETLGQFTPDGGNFEASTSYHRLSAEIVVFATALALGLPETERWREPIRWPDEFVDRLGMMARFTRQLIKMDGSAGQFGDNDCGRFVKLLPGYDRLSVTEAKARFWNLRGYSGLSEDAVYWLERTQDHRHGIEAIDALFHGTTEEAPSVERTVLQSLARGNWLSPDHRRGQGVGLPRQPLLTKSVGAFPDFGLFVYRSPAFHLVLRCGTVGQHGTGGHAHNDQLSFELSVGGRDLIVDPGTYLYTPSPRQRNRYRATAMHNTLSMPEYEQNTWEPGARGLFSLRRACVTRVVDASGDRWIGEHDGYGPPHRRTVRIQADRLEVSDELSLAGLKTLAFHLAPGVAIERAGRDTVALRIGRVLVSLQTMSADAEWAATEYLYSRGYGWLEPAVCVHLSAAVARIDWNVQIEEVR